MPENASSSANRTLAVDSKDNKVLNLPDSNLSKCFLIEQGGKADKLLMPDIDERHICSEITLKTAFFDDDCGLLLLSG